MEKGDLPITSVITIAIGAMFGTMLLAGIFATSDRGGAQVDQGAELEFNEFVDQVESACETVETGDYSTKAGSLNLPSGTTIVVDDESDTATLNGDSVEEFSCNAINSIEYSGTTGFSITPSENGVSFR